MVIITERFSDGNNYKWVYRRTGEGFYPVDTGDSDNPFYSMILAYMIVWKDYTILVGDDFCVDIRGINYVNDPPQNHSLDYYVSDYESCPDDLSAFLEKTFARQIRKDAKREQWWTSKVEA